MQSPNDIWKSAEDFRREAIAWRRLVAIHAILIVLLVVLIIR